MDAGIRYDYESLPGTIRRADSCLWIPDDLWSCYERPVQSESMVQANDLARAIASLGEQLAADPSNEGTTAFRVTVEGEPRDLQPILRDEVYRIGGEALQNAYRHAHARQIEVELRYDDKEFRLRVRDDGKGREPAVVAKQARSGHYGLPGMKERAKLAGGNLTLWSEVGAGAEVELTIPAAIAYSGSERRAWLSRMLARKSS